MLLAFFLFLVVGTTQGEYEECDTNIELEMDGRKEIRSKNFPLSDPAGTACRWFVHSPVNTRIYVSCPTLDQDTCNGMFSVQRLHQPTVYCNNKLFYEFSTDNWMILTYNVKQNISSSGSSFICYFNVQNVSYTDACNSCGQRNKVPTTGVENTSIHEYPMVAAIVAITDRQRLCGATIISPKYSLTAATRIFNKYPQKIALVVGEHNRYQVNQSETDVIEINKIIVYPEFERGEGLRFANNDLALVRLKTPLIFTHNIAPACLPKPGDLLRNNGVTFFGWETPSPDPIPTLRKMPGIVLGHSKCTGILIHLNQTGSSTSHFCYDSREMTRCRGDLGSPFLVEEDNKFSSSRKIKIVGITATEEGCSYHDNRPSLNTDVGLFVDWIKENAAGEIFCAE